MPWFLDSSKLYNSIWSGGFGWQVPQSNLTHYYYSSEIYCVILGIYIICFCVYAYLFIQNIEKSWVSGSEIPDWDEFGTPFGKHVLHGFHGFGFNPPHCRSFLHLQEVQKGSTNTYIFTSVHLSRHTPSCWHHIVCIEAKTWTCHLH